MYYLNDICSLCLARNKNFKSLINIGSNAGNILTCIIPEYILQETEIPKQICVECLNSLNRMSIFRQKCLKNIDTFNSYVKKLKQECGVIKHVAIMLTDISLQTKNDIYNDHEKNETRADAPFYKIEEMIIKREIFNTDNCKLDEEIIIREESCFFEDDKQNYYLEVKSEHSHDIDDRSEITEKQSESLSGNYSDQIDSHPVSPYTNKIEGRENRNVNGGRRLSYSKTVAEKLNHIQTEEHQTSTPTCEQFDVLNEHKSIHTDERLHTCSSCQKTFNRISALKKHKSTTSTSRKRKIDEIFADVKLPENTYGISQTISYNTPDRTSILKLEAETGYQVMKLEIYPFGSIVSKEQKDWWRNVALKTILVRCVSENIQKA